MKSSFAVMVLLGAIVYEYDAAVQAVNLKTYI